jgi:hypothetical protein
MALAPWCKDEKWVFSQTPDFAVTQDNPEGCRYGRVTGRQRCPASLRNNPFWWFLNSYEQQLSDAPWYHPDWPQWKRVIYWYFFRNPANNGKMFVWGYADRNYSLQVVEGHPNPLGIQRNDFIDPATGKPEEGRQHTRLYAFEDGTADKEWTAESKNPTPTQDGYQHSAGVQPSGLSDVKANTIKWETWPYK